jgi:predicted RNase H-like HicB family nuclease
MSTGREIRLVEEDDGWWSAIDRETGVASQGETRHEALENLDEAVEVTEETRDDDTSAPEPDLLPRLKTEVCAIGLYQQASGTGRVS